VKIAVKSPGFLVAILATAVFLPSVVTGGFLEYDDGHYLVHSRAVAEQDVRRALDPLADRSDLGSEYLPVRDLLYLGEARVFGLESPRAFRGMSLALYAAACALAYALLAEVTKNEALSFLAAALFAVHPAHAESVAWISSQKDVLSGVLGLAALVLHARGWWPAGVVLALLACLSKSTLLCLPLLVPIVERRLSWRVVPYIVVSLVVSRVAVSVGLREGIAHPQPPGGLATVLMTDAPIFVRYLASAFAPFDLRVTYHASFPIRTVADATVARCFLVLLAAAVGFASVRVREVRFGALAFLLALLPVANLQPGAQWIADRYLFLPVLGTSVIVARVLTRVASRSAPLSIGLASLLLASSGWLALEHGLDFSNDVRLFRQALAWEPANPIAHHQLGRGLLAKAERTEDKGTRAAIARAAAAEEQEAVRLFVQPGVLDAGPVIEARHSLARALELAGETVLAVSAERQTLVIEAVRAHLEGRDDAEIRARAVKLGRVAYVQAKQNAPDAPLLVEAARCLAFGHDDDLARHAATEAYEFDSELVEKAIREDAELERVFK